MQLRCCHGWFGVLPSVILGMAAAGCHSTSETRLANSSPAFTAYASGGVPGPSASRLLPHAQVAWAITTRQNPDKSILTGKERITADGTLEMGPYGQVPVAGLTVEQARAAMEKHLANYVTDPRVSLRLLGDERTAALKPRLQDWGSAVQLAKPRPTGIVAADYKADDAGPRTPAASGDMPLSDDLPDAKVFKGPEPTRLKAEPALAGPLVSIGDPIPRELRKVNLPPYVIEPPDVLLVELTQTANEGLKETQVVRGQHLVRPDGTINLGVYGSVLVSGMTLDQAKEAVFEQLKKRNPDAFKGDKALFQMKDVNVDVIAYNSKVYYVITDGGGYGEQVYRIPFTGNETVLDAFGQINGLPAVSSKKHIWLARRGESGANRQLPVDWCGLTQRGDVSTNYQIMPGDRIYVKADKWITFDNGLGKRLAPIERILGGTLLGSQAVNSIEGKGLSTVR